MGNLAYLASRRSSRDSEAGDVAPLDCTRYRRRRTSNFLELPGKFEDIVIIISIIKLKENKTMISEEYGYRHGGNILHKILFLFDIFCS